MDLADFVTVKLMIPLGSIVLCLFAGWVVEPRLAQTVRESRKLHKVFLGLWKIMCRFVAPVAIAWVLVAGLSD